MRFAAWRPLSLEKSSATDAYSSGDQSRAYARLAKTDTSGVLPPSPSVSRALPLVSDVTVGRQWEAALAVVPASRLLLRHAAAARAQEPGFEAFLFPPKQFTSAVDCSRSFPPVLQGLVLIGALQKPRLSASHSWTIRRLSVSERKGVGPQKRRTIVITSPASSRSPLAQPRRSMQASTRSPAFFR